MGPRIIILDPTLTTTTPLHVWLSTGVRAVDHCVEALCSIEGRAGGEIAEKGLKRLLPGLLTTKEHPENLEARLACQLGAVDAISAPLNRMPMGASHGIGHQLGPLGVGHGETSCILLPAVCKYNKRVNAEKQQRVLDILWAEDAVFNVLYRAGIDQGKADLGEVLDVVFRALGMPRSLKEVGVGRDKFDALAMGSLNDRWCKTNPVPLKEKEQVLEILDMCSGEPSKLTNGTRAEEQTFKQYSAAQAKAYSAGRVSLHVNLFNAVLDHHTATGGQFGTLLDVGCGPGNSTRPLAKHFDVAYGTDPSEEMINTAREPGANAQGKQTLSGKKVEFAVGRAEDVTFAGRDLESQIDLLTAAAAVCT